MMKHVLAAAIVTLLVAACGSPALAQVRKLSDGELDRVTAGNASTPAPAVPARVDQPPLSFEFKGPAGSRHVVDATGTVQVLDNTAPTVRDRLVIRDNAQQNLQSLINVTAVNSRIQVLVNLNIAINSTIASLNQVNASAGP